MTQFMDIDETIKLLKKLKFLYDIKEIDIGALEPFLYNKNNKDIVDFIKALENINFSVKITTNGSLLEKFIDKLGITNIKKIRVSLHSLDNDFFSNITSSNNLDKIKRGVVKAHKKGLPIEINCLVFKGYEQHMLDVIEFALKHNIPLKLYNLYYFSLYKEYFKKYYISANEIVDILKFYFKDYSINYVKNINKRNRIIFKIKDNIEFIIKDDVLINRDNPVCKNCKYIYHCNEQYGEYIRINPDLNLYLCYLRKDLQFSLNDVMLNLKDITFSNKIQLRLIVSSLCNHKCVFPNSNKMWCLKQGGNYRWK